MTVISSTTDQDRPIPTMTSSELLKGRAKRMTLDMPSALHRELKMVSLDREVYMRDIIIEAVRQWLEAEKAKNRKEE